jgi:deoxyribonuclease-4
MRDLTLRPALRWRHNSQDVAPDLRGTGIHPDGCREPERFCVCIDTAHLFAAGYDLGSDEGVTRTFALFKKLIGFERLAAIHMNDSKAAAGSRVDRHEHIGKGKIGLDAFRYIMREPRFRNIPKVLETPKGRDMAEDVVNLATLRSLLRESAHT